VDAEFEEWSEIINKWSETMRAKAVLWSSLLLSAASIPALAVNIEILTVSVSTDLKTLTINGQGFSAGEHVFLGATEITTQLQSRNSHTDYLLVFESDSDRGI
jgi:hypothetical protein